MKIEKELAGFFGLPIKFGFYSRLLLNVKKINSKIIKTT